MTMSLDIGEVADATGLTHRALRFYETRGLVTPLRTVAGRRVYGADELARLNAVTALKQAGFSLTRIADMLGDRPFDLSRLVGAQLAHIDAQAKTLAASRALLLAVQSALDRGRSVDVTAICALIRTGRTIMDRPEWKLVVDDFFTPDDRRQFHASLPDGIGGEANAAQWRALAARIDAALPLDPRSTNAQAFVDEWFVLLKPFSQVATPAMWSGTARMYDGRPGWKAQPDVGFSHAVWLFIREATAARLASGGTIDGPVWMTADRRAGNEVATTQPTDLPTSCDNPNTFPGDPT